MNNSSECGLQNVRHTNTWDKIEENFYIKEVFELIFIINTILIKSTD